MAEDENPPTTGGKTEGKTRGAGEGSSGGTKKYYIAKNSMFDEYQVNKGEKVVTKQFDWTEPADLTDDEAKDARAMGVNLVEAKT